MNLDRLRTDLAELAETATPVDLRDRALRTSRRLAVQRAVASTAAALVVLGAATGVGLAALPRDNAGPAPATTITPSTPPTPTPDASPTPGTDPSAGATGGPTGGAPSGTAGQPAGPAGGFWYFVRASNETGKDVAGQLWHKAPGGRWQVVKTVRDDSIEFVKVASPDGRQVAWYDKSSTPQKLRVSNIDGSGVRTLATFDQPTCVRPWWTADSARIVFGSGQQLDKVETIRADGTGRKTFPGADCESGATTRTGLYASVKDGKVVVNRLDGGGTPTTSPKVKVPAGTTLMDVQAISDDGRRALVGSTNPNPGGCECSRDFRYHLVDLSTGASGPVERPSGVDALGEGHIAAAYFLPSGGFVAQINLKGFANDPPSYRLVVHSSTGKLTSTSTVPAGSPYGSLLAHQG